MFDGRAIVEFEQFAKRRRQAVYVLGQKKKKKKKTRLSVVGNKQRD